MWEISALKKTSSLNVWLHWPFTVVELSSARTLKDLHIKFSFDADISNGTMLSIDQMPLMPRRCSSSLVSKNSLNSLARVNLNLSPLFWTPIAKMTFAVMLFLSLVTSALSSSLFSSKSPTIFESSSQCHPSEYEQMSKNGSFNFWSR